MKSSFRTGKRDLSVFMAVLMVMTAWVFVAPEKADAATAGSYDVRVIWKLNDDANPSNRSYTGKAAAKGKNNSGSEYGLSVFYRDNNGTETSEKEVYWDLGNSNCTGGGSGSNIKSNGYCNSSKGKTYESTATITGFPTEIFGYINGNNSWPSTDISIDFQSLSVKPAGKDVAWKPLWSGSLSMWAYIGVFYAEKRFDGSASRNDSDVSWSNQTATWDLPYPAKIEYTVDNTKTIKVPMSGSNSATTNGATVYDQYDVSWKDDPTWYYSKNKDNPTSITIGGIGISTNSNYGTVSVDHKASGVSIFNGGKVGYIYAYPYITYGGKEAKGETSKFTIYDTCKTTYQWYETNTSDLANPTQKSKDVEVIYGGNPTAPTVTNSYYTNTAHYWNGKFTSPTAITKNESVSMTYQNSTGHSLTVITNNGNTQNGTHNIKCSGCDYNYDQNHDWDNGEITTSPTCQRTGVKTYTCKLDDCDATYTETLAKVGCDFSGGWHFNENGANSTHDHYCSYGCGAHGGDATKCTFTYSDDKATCETDGLRTYTCSVCDGQYTEVLPATGHNFSAQVVDEQYLKSAATCYDPAVYYYSCNNGTCGKSSKDFPEEATFTSGTKLGHSWVETVTVEASCTQVGNKHKECSRCGRSEDEEIPLKAHTYPTTWTVVKEPTCTESGLKEHYCTVCLVKKETAVIPHKGHDHSTEFTVDVEPTCTELGSKSRHCTRPGCDSTIEPIPIAALGHDMKEKDVARTCEEEGYKLHYCDREGCDYSYKTDTEPKLGHDLPTQWTYQNDATCTSDGTETKECARCHKILSQTAVGTKLSHVFTKYVPDGNQTCTYGSYETATCDYDGVYHCGATDTRPGTPLPHAYTYVEHDNWTCTKLATKTGTCPNCGHVAEFDIPGTAPGHDYGDWIVTTPAKCEETGMKKRICKREIRGEVCGHIEYEVIPATGHKNLPVQVEGFVDSTCTKEGVYYDVIRCEYCNEVQISTKVTIPAKGHDWAKEAVETYRILPTCLVPGEYRMVYFCNRCGVENEATSYTVPIDALGHADPVWVIKDGDGETCEKDGKFSLICPREGCGEVFETTVIPATGHNYSEVSEVAPTCVERGHTLHRCVNVHENGGRCQSSFKTDFTVFGTHSYGEPEKDEASVKAATCEGKGSYEMVTKCKYCGDEISRRIVETPALGHTPGAPVEDERKEPGCTTPGYYYLQINCEVCGNKLSRDPVSIPATGHSPKAPVKERVVPATCASAGSYDEVVYCNNCDVEISRTTSNQPKLNHTPAEAVIENNSASTCGKPGNYDLVVYCSVCHSELSREKKYSESVPHTRSTEWKVLHMPTCFEVGTEYLPCAVCGEKLELRDIPMTDHIYDNGVVTAPTCTAKGYTTYSCVNEGCTDSYKTNETEMVDHVYRTSNVKSTCMTEGYTLHECTVCGSSYTTDPVAKIDHKFSAFKETTPGTCSRKAVLSRTCLSCGTVETKQGDFGTHVEVIVKGTPATCEEPGLTDGKVCSECGTVFTAQTTIPAKGHKDDNKDHKCDNCSAEYNADRANCSCICHKTNFFMRFIYAIKKFFWKLFKTTKICYCGDEHY